MADVNSVNAIIQNGEVVNTNGTKTDKSATPKGYDKDAFMQILVFIRVYRINLNADVAEILPCNLYSLADVLHIRVRPALTCQNQNFLHAGIRDHLHLMLDLLE